MKKLFEQIVKFGLVGVIAFIIDEGVMNLLLLAHVNNVLSSTASFLISLVFNYWASMKYVFVHRSDMARWMEVLIFVLSSVVGLGINELIIWASTLGMDPGAAVAQHGMYTLRTNVGKLVATVVVAIWNFIIRKWLLDASGDGKNDDSVSAQGADNPQGTRSAKASDASDSDSGTLAGSGPAVSGNGFSHRLGIWSLEHTPQGWR